MDEIDTLLKSNKRQTDQINDLKERLNELHSNLQEELYSYMSRLSDLQIHKENLELTLRNQINSDQDRLKSLQMTVVEKETQIAELKSKIDELNEDYQSRFEAELNHLKYINESRVVDDSSKADELAKLKEDFEKLNEKYLVELERASFVAMQQNLLDSKNDEIDELSKQVLFDTIELILR